MKRTLLLPLAALLLSPTAVFAQQVNSITAAGLGFPVPLPVDSLESVEGFRSYDSLRARHAALALENDFITPQQVGTSIRGRSITAYRFRRGTATDPEGRPRPGVFLSGTMHPREWASPEVITEVYEWLALDTSDTLRNHVLDRLDVVILPIANPDALVVTQAFPSQTVGGGSDGANGIDGRMRRKNMRGADDVLGTTADAAFGVDANRNLSVGYGQGSSGSPTSITYRGTAAFSEPETQAVSAAAALLTGTVRLAIDYHSFSQLYYVIHDGSATRNSAVDQCYQLMSAAAEATSGLRYTSIETVIPGEAIGAVDEYMTGTYRAMSYTCEIRPVFASNGFILPDSEIGIARDELLVATKAGLYYASGPAALIEVRLLFAEEELESSLAAPDSLTTRSALAPIAVEQGGIYTLELRWNKPVRVFRDGAWQLLPGMTGSANPPALTLPAGMDATFERWGDAGDRVRYTIGVAADAALGAAGGSVALVDAVGEAPDTNPQTSADWSATGWQRWERTGAATVPFTVVAGSDAGATLWQAR
jgi:hypothetical protein